MAPPLCSGTRPGGLALSAARSWWAPRPASARFSTDATNPRVPVGELQLPRTRGERLRHLEILQRVPYDMVEAYEARNRALAGQRAVANSIGKVLRRYGSDAVTVLLNTMLEACVEKRRDEMLWDTIGQSLHDEVDRMTASDIGIALSCLVKSQYGRDDTLVRRLLCRLASQASAAGAPPAGPAPATQVAAASGGGRRHRARAQLRATAPGGAAAAVPSSPSRGPPKGPPFPEHALAAGVASAQHGRLGQACADDLAKLCGCVLRIHATISDAVLCRIVHSAGGLASAPPGDPARRSGNGAARLLTGLREHLTARLRASASWPPGDLCLVAHAYAHARPTAADRPLFATLHGHLDEVALLRLSATELAGLANSFCKLQLAEDLGFTGPILLSSWVFGISWYLFMMVGYWRGS